MTTTIKSITAADWAPYIKRAAYGLAAAIACTYTAGLLTGEFVHRLNDRLAAWVGRGGNLKATLTSSAPVTIPVVVEPIRVQRQAPQPVATIAAPDLSTLTVAQLRVMARAAGHKGIARSGRRAQLLEVLG